MGQEEEDGWRVASLADVNEGGHGRGDLIKLLKESGLSSVRFEDGLVYSTGRLLLNTKENVTHLLMVQDTLVSSVTHLTDMFPDVESSLVMELLKSNRGDVTKTVDQLLQLSPTTKVCPPVNDGPVIEQPLPPARPPIPPRPPAVLRRSRPNPCPSCPVCYELLEPPKKIFQCGNGHVVCEDCYNQPTLRQCPSCKGSFIGRAIAMEQFLVELRVGTQGR